jgi:hypothetical protein
MRLFRQTAEKTSASVAIVPRLGVEKMNAARKTKLRRNDRVHKSYLNLIVELPLTSIKSQHQLDAAQAMIDLQLRKTRS